MAAADFDVAILGGDRWRHVYKGVVFWLTILAVRPGSASILIDSCK
jgi:hypothetical protein